MIFVIVFNLISCLAIATFCSFNSRKCERKSEKADGKEAVERKDALLQISDNFLDPDDPESSSLRGVSSDVAFPQTVTTVEPPKKSDPPLSSPPMPVTSMNG